MAVRVERCLTGRLREAYPVAAHDVELQVSEVPLEQLTAVLAQESSRILTEDPFCRKVVYGAPQEDLAVMAAAEQAGFRFVVDVDVNGAPGEIVQLSLLVREPDYVTRVDMDLDRVPQT